MICPAYFDENHVINLYKPVYTTDWLHRKTRISAKVAYEPLPLSQFKKVTLRVAVADASQLPLVTRVVRYAIYENERELGKYPMDDAVMAGEAHFYIKKDQSVKFVLDEGYDHLLDVRLARN